MKKSEYIIPQIYVVKLRQQPLMQYASATPTLRSGQNSKTDWKYEEDGEDDLYNL